MDGDFSAEKSKLQVQPERATLSGIDKLNAQPNKSWADITDHAAANFQDANVRNRNNL